MDACAMIKNRKFCPKERKPILATTERPFRKSPFVGPMNNRFLRVL